MIQTTPKNSFQDRRFGLYIHWPYCASRCPYCDFNAHEMVQVDEKRWADAYKRAIDFYAEKTPGRPLVSIFFGGGTPSLMSPELVREVIDHAQQSWRFVNDIEITLEANPTSVEAAKFEAFRAAGVNRVSIGVQALNDVDLQFLGRKHSAAEARAAIKIAADVFERYSFDLIYARPNQTLKNWREELEATQEFAPDHLSLYQLTIERSTPFYVQHRQGLFDIPSEDLAADFYHLTQDVMEGQGLPAYEVSNHAKPGQESRHNLLYWNYEDYIGIGPGAHGRLTVNGQKQALRDHAAPDIWLQRVEEYAHGAHPPQLLSAQEQFLEMLMMGLRLPGGMPLDRLQHKTGIAFEDGVDAQSLQRVCEEGWTVCEDGVLRLSREGLLRLNAIVPYIIAAE